MRKRWWSLIGLCQPRMFATIGSFSLFHYQSQKPVHANQALAFLVSLGLSCLPDGSNDYLTIMLFDAAEGTQILAALICACRHPVPFMLKANPDLQKLLLLLLIPI